MLPSVLQGFHVLLWDGVHDLAALLVNVSQFPFKGSRGNMPDPLLLVYSECLLGSCIKSFHLCLPDEVILFIHSRNSCLNNYII